jgi:hypothetical protein
VLLFFVDPDRPLPTNEMPLIPGPVPSLSYSMHGLELVQVGSITPPALAGYGLPAPVTQANIKHTRIANAAINSRFIAMSHSPRGKQPLTKA